MAFNDYGILAPKFSGSVISLSSHSNFVSSPEEQISVSKMSLIQIIRFHVAHGIGDLTLSPIQFPTCGLLMTSWSRP